MIVSDILEKAYRLTNTDVNTFLDGDSANVLSDLNNCYRHRALKISKIRQDLNPLITEQKTDLLSITGLTEGQIGFNGEYPFSADTLKPLRVEVSYDGVTFVKAKVYDLNDNNNSEFDKETIQSTFSTSSPAVRFERDSYFVRPLQENSTTTNGIHLWWEKRPTEMIDGSPEIIELSIQDILSYDLARLEVMMHPDRYQEPWLSYFNSEHGKLESLFEDFYKNRMKRTMQLRPNNISYK